MISSHVKIKVLTDHQSLQHWHTEDLNNMIGSVARRGRWHEFLSQFNLEVVYVPGSEHKVSDALSRWAYPASVDTQERTFHGDSRAQKFADLADELENEMDFKEARIQVLQQSLFQEIWKYGCTKWKKIYSDLQRNVQHDYFYLEKDKLFHKGKLCIPKNRSSSVIQFYHSSGHPSGYKLLDIVLHRCEFEEDQKTVHTQCQKVAQSCHICQAVKPHNQSYSTLDFCPVPDQIFSSLCMDFLSLPKVTGQDGQQYDSVFVIVDRLSGYILAIPCLKEGLTAEGAARLFMNHCVQVTGVTLEMLSDCDHLITGNFFQALCDELGIEQHTAIIYRPKGNGRAERAVRSVITVLRLTLIGLPKGITWTDVLPWSCFLQNSLPGVIAGYSPHKIVFGRDLLKPGELPREDTQDAPVSAKAWFKKLDEDRKAVQNRINQVHEKERLRYQKEHCLQKFEPGDRVWLKVHSKDRSKLDPLWMGPCEVLKHVRSGRYTVKTPYGDEDHHVDQMKLYKPELTGKIFHSCIINLLLFQKMKPGLWRKF